MSENNEYKRYFIILQEDDKGYEISPGKNPTGYVKIEVKNRKVKLNAFVQNVRVEGADEYRLILVASKRNTAVDVGKIIVDGSGRGELYYELESDNVLKSGINISEFGVAAVTCGISIPLSGYYGREKTEWKGKYEIINRPKAAEPPRIDKKIEIEEIVPEIQEPIKPSPIIKEPVKEPEPIKKEMKPIPKEETDKKPEPIEMPPPTDTAQQENIITPENVTTAENVTTPENITTPENVIPPENIKTPENITVPQNVAPPANVKAPKTTAEPVGMPEASNKEMPLKKESPVMKCPPRVPMEEPVEEEYLPIMQEKEAVKEDRTIEAPKGKPYDYQDYYYEDDESEESDSYKSKQYTEKKHAGSKTCYYYNNVMHSRIRRLLRRLRRCEPFEDEENYEWFRVGDELFTMGNVVIPYMGYMMPIGYPFMMEGYGMMMNRKDLILGVRYETNDDRDKRTIDRIMFGIPAVYSRRNEAYYRSRGFMSFKPHKSRQFGYFIMCIDMKSGMFCKSV